MLSLVNGSFVVGSLNESYFELLQENNENAPLHASNSQKLPRTSNDTEENNFEKPYEVPVGVINIRESKYSMNARRTLVFNGDDNDK